MQKVINRFSQNVSGKLAHGPLKKRLDFVGNLDHATLGLELGWD